MGQSSTHCFTQCFENILWKVYKTYTKTCKNVHFYVLVS